MEERGIPESQAIRSRSFGGCATCRSRHVKCDEGHPACSMCGFLGLVCGGYEKNIFFDFANTSGDGTVRFRRPLLTEEERQRMSEWLVSTVPPRQAFQLLSHIDDECERAGTDCDFHVSRGPFGAFRLSKDLADPTPALLPDQSEDLSPPQASNSQDLIQIINGYPSYADLSLSPSSQELLQSIIHQSEQIPISPSLGFLDLPMESGRIHEVFEGIPMPELPEFPFPLSVADDYLFSQIASGAEFGLPSSNDSFSSFSLSNTNNYVPQDAVLLLQHYATKVISSLTPFRHSKTPWHILFLPHVKNCLAALMLGEQVDHANLGAFYGILAISAYSLGIVCQSQMWLEQARTYKQRAREHSKLMLKTAYNIPKAAKYKSILIALITMVQISMFSGNRDQMEGYLLEAEKFIRLRGLKRRKSRKVRLLHHCYVYMRLFHETTFVSGANARQRQLVRNAVESSGLIIYGQDSLSFRLMGWTNLDQEMMGMKSQEMGENDLHIGQPGLFPATLYPEIYGVPETWFFLLSQVIRLGNEKDAAELDDPINPLSLQEFASRAKALEKCITQLERSNQGTNAFASRHRQVEPHVLDEILDGMQSALAIYFYRRIYDVSASLLQQKVLSIRDWLLRCEPADSNVVYGSVGFMWPAFIGACEAEDPEVQMSFSNWFRNSAQRDGLPYFTKTLADIERVWEEKRSGKGTNVTWLDLMKKHVSLQPPL